MDFPKINKALAMTAAALALAATAAQGQEAGGSAASGKWRFGTELDVLPYATKGYYGSFIAARDAWRVRGVAARSNVPGFMVEDGFNDKRTDAYAFLVDRFLGRKGARQQGWWIGGGVEVWKNRIRAEGYSEYTHYNNLMLTAGGGYVWRISRHFYINPWAGAHFAVAGERSPVVNGRVYEQPRFVPEASIKFGFDF